MRLVQTRSVSEQDMEVSTDQLRTAEAALAEAKAGVRAAEAAVSAASAQRDKSDADVRVAEAQRPVADADRRHTAAVLAYATIKAPFDGVVTRRTVDVGQFVQPTSGPGGAPPLFVVVRTNPVRIFVDTPEADAPFVGRGTPARIRVQALRDGEVTGAVSRSSWVLDNQTRTLRTQIDLPNDDGLLRPGMYASAHITVERPGVWLIPSSVVASGDDHPHVVLRGGGKDVRTPVKLGARQGDLVEVLQKQTKAKQDGYSAVWEPFTGGEEVVAEIR
jgi:HlyD family secretion protein